MCLIDRYTQKSKVFNKSNYHWQREKWLPTSKRLIFDIQSLADQLHRSKSTYLEGPKRGEIYFSENQVPDLIKLNLKYLPRAVKAYKKAVQKNSAHDKAVEVDTINKSIEKLFRQARNNSAVTSDLFGAE